MLDRTKSAPSRPSFATPPLAQSRPPRCPPFVEITNSDQLLPYLEHVAQRPYNHGLNACWDLKEGERVLLRVDNWHSELTIQACQKILEKYKVKYEIQKIDRQPSAEAAISPPKRAQKPVIHPTLQTGIEAFVTAVTFWLAP